MTLLLLHGSGWDEFLLLGGAVFLAYFIVKMTSRGNSDDPDDSAA
jgi:hypothetical protein